MPVTFRQVAKFVWSYLRKKPLWLTSVIGLLILQAGIEIIAPNLLGWLADFLAENADNPAAAIGGVTQILVLIGITGISFWTINKGKNIFWDWWWLPMMKQALRDSLFKVQRFSTDWHVNSFAGATVRKITRGLWAMNSFVDQTILFGFVPLTLLIIGMTGVMFWRWQLLGIAMIIGTIVYASISIWLTTKIIAPRGRAAARADTQVGAALADTITCNATVKSFGQENIEDLIFEKIAEKWKRATWKVWLGHNSVDILQAIGMTSFKFGLLIPAVWLWVKGIASVGEVVFVFASYNLISSHLRGIGERIRETQKATNDMEDFVEFSLMPFAVTDRKNAKKLRVKKGAIEFKNITFQYPNQKRPMFKNFSLKIQAGEKIALVGHSGGGKTTFVKLVQRLYDVQDGAIMIDRQNLAEVTQESLRQQIGLVPQEPLLFHRSLAENIAYGRPAAKLDEIKRVAKLAHAAEFIEKLPDKYETLVGERGVKLSGGERQRVAIARAMLADTPILVLDEATSSLDSSSEKLIQDALKKLIRRRTTIMIAHRLSTIKSADRILVFEKGKIIESGSHTQLVRKKGGLYRKLYELQAGGFIGE